jgi:hypothetical protein
MERKINLNELRDKAYQCAVAHGWHEEEYTDKHWLCLVIAELMEAVEADRIGKYADRNQFESYMSLRERSDDEFVYAFKHGIKDTVEDELCDTCIRIFDLAGLRNINLSSISFPIENSKEHIENRSKLTFTEWCYDVTRVIVRYNKDNYPIGYLFIGILQELCCIAKIKNFDLLWHIEEKMRYNSLRPYKYGNKAY